MLHFLNLFSQNQELWQKLSNERRPIVIYGMGDGAVKIVNACKQFHIPISGFFASDEFVRGHSFLGFPVLSLSQTEEKYNDFVILLAFGAGYPSLIEKIKQIAKKHTLYAPDVELLSGEPFTYRFLQKNTDLLQKVYDLWADTRSKETFIEILRYKLTGDISHLFTCEEEKSEIFQNVLRLSPNETYVDLGAYRGDTVDEFLHYCDNRYQRILALEPDPKTYRKLQQHCQSYQNIQCFNYGAWSKSEQVPFSYRTGRQAAIDLASKRTQQMVAVDDLLQGNTATYIKMDVEGAEQEAILGCAKTISTFQPKLNIGLYHRNKDLFTLPLLIKQLQPNYQLYLRHHPYIPAWDTNLYAI